MMQDERWQQNYEEVMRFVKTNHRNLSKYDLEQRRLYMWMKHNRKLMNAGGMKPERMELFNQLLEMGDRYRHVNQYT